MQKYVGRRSIDPTRWLALRGEIAYVVAVDASVLAAWPSTTITEALARIERAVAWIRAQAGMAGRLVLFYRFGAVAHFHTITLEDLPPAPLPKLRAAIARHAEPLRAIVPDAQFFVIGLTMAPGCGFAMPSALGTCVCEVGASPGTFAHEILHLFGAVDLYRDARGTLAAIRARNGLVDDAIALAPPGELATSIMACAAELEDATLDCYTGHAIGLAAAWPDDPLPTPATTTGLDLWAISIALAALLAPLAGLRAALAAGAVAVELVRRRRHRKSPGYGVLHRT